MAYQTPAGDIVSLSDPEAGAMAMSVPLHTYSPSSIDGPGLYRQDAVRTVVRFIASNQASVPFDLYRRLADDDREKVRDGVVAPALRSPQRGMTQFRFLEALTLDMLLHDRWVFLISDEGDRLRFRRIPAQQTSLVIDVFGEVQDVRVWPRNGGQPKDVPAAQCVWDVGYDADGNPSQTIGTPVAPTLSSLVNELRRGAEYRDQMYANGARIPMYVYRPADAPAWSKDGSRDRFIESFKNYTSGGGKAGGTPLLEDGMELRGAPTRSPADTQWLEGRKLTVVEVANFFHVPPELVGAREGNYSNLKEFRDQLYRDVLGPRITATEQAFNAGLGDWLGDDQYIEANVNAKLRGSFEERAAVISTAVGAPYLTRNEARALDNRPAIEGGDELVTPLNVVTGGLASPRDTAPPPKHRPQAGRKASEGLAPLETERAALEADLQRFWARQGATLAAALDVKALPALADEFNIAEWSAELEPVLAGRTMRVAEAAASEVLDEYNPDAEGWSADVMHPWLRTAAETNARRWNESLYQQIANELAGGEGWQDRVKTMLTTAAFAAMWARTFSTEAASFGAHDAARASGLGTKTWHVNSKKPRPSHAALNGQTVGIDDIFGNGCRWPGDTGGGAAEVAGCSCSVTYSRGE